MTDVAARVHSTVARFEVLDGQLVIGGVPVSRLAQRVGTTPFFAYDRALITARFAELRAALPPQMRVSYAVKANPMPAVVHHCATVADHLDVASAGEMRVALDTGIPPAAVTFAGPGKTDGELARAVAAGVTLEIESASEATRALALADRLGVAPRLAVRVNPDFMVRGSGMRMGGGPQQFGIDAERVPEVVHQLTARGADVLGFHVFAGSQNLHAHILSEAYRRTADLVVRLADQCRIEVRYVNMGGGFGIPYTHADEPLDLGAVSAVIHDVVDRVLEPRLPVAALVMEFGRFLVGEAGVYVTRVVDRKESRGRTYLVVDGGMHHQLAASGNLGTPIRKNYPLVVADRMAGANLEEVSVVGCLCTPLDVLGDRITLPQAEVGDLVAVFQAGAYGLTASPQQFLGHPAPAEVLVGVATTAVRGVPHKERT